MSNLQGLALENELRRLVSEAARNHITLRAIGGLAIKLHSKTASQGDFRRDYPDIDFITDKTSARHLNAFLKQMGYTPNQNVNTLYGDRRQIYFNASGKWHIDFLIGEFEMCHKLPLQERLYIEPYTVPLAELFLTKAQIVQINRKDILDLIALLLDHPIGDNDNETINAGRIASLCAHDWGLCQTVTRTLQKIGGLINEGQITLNDQQITHLRYQLNAIRASIETPPRSIGWKVRAKIGTRLRWYNEVEEVYR